MTTSVPTPTPQKVSIDGNQYELVAFYFPGNNTPWDTIYNAPFLGNFWIADLTLQPPYHQAGTFHCAEAAFQATKWWDKPPQARADFENCADGNAAFRLKRKLQQQGYDHTYTGMGRMGAMAAVLEAKFSVSALANALLQTGGAYLLEHNSHLNRDAYWSDNCDGTGDNHLGLELMRLRAALGGTGLPAGAPAVEKFSTLVQGATACR